MNSESEVIIDASVALKWCFEDEDHTGQALQLLADATDHKIKLCAPGLWIYEVSNALRTAVQRQRIHSGDKALEYLDHFLKIGVALVPMDKVRFEFILKTAIQYQLSVYDASYLDLADQRKCLFYTGDKRLYNSMNKVSPRIQWIGDYKHSL